MMRNRPRSREWPPKESPASAFVPISHGTVSLQARPWVLDLERPDAVHAQEGNGGAAESGAYGHPTDSTSQQVHRGRNPSEDAGRCTRRSRRVRLEAPPGECAGG